MKTFGDNAPVFTGRRARPTYLRWAGFQSPIERGNCMKVIKVRYGDGSCILRGRGSLTLGEGTAAFRSAVLWGAGLRRTHFNRSVGSWEDRLPRAWVNWCAARRSERNAVNFAADHRHLQPVSRVDDADETGDRVRFRRFWDQAGGLTQSENAGHFVCEMARSVWRQVRRPKNDNGCSVRLALAQWVGPPNLNGATSNPP